MTPALLASTLEDIAKVKLRKLDENRVQFEARRKVIVDDVKNQTTEADKLHKLIDGLKTIGIHKERRLINVPRYLEQAAIDSSVSDAQIEALRTQAEGILRDEGSKLEFASLYGRLVADWQEIQSVLATSRATPSQTAKGDENLLILSDNESFVSVPSADCGATDRARKDWEALSLSKDPKDTTRGSEIKEYLRGLFQRGSLRLNKDHFELLQKQLQNFKIKEPLDTQTVRWCIDGLLRNDVFSGDKRQVLVELKKRSDVLGELADSLNMSLDSIDTWNWKSSPVFVGLRKHLNGKFRAYLDEDIHEAILLQFIGLSWSVYLKKCLNEFKSCAWTQPKTASETEAQDPKAYRHTWLTRNPTENLRSVRHREYQATYFMSQLPNTMKDGSREYKDEPNEHAEIRTKVTGNNATTGNLVGGLFEMGQGDSKTSIAVKQSLLRTATTEMLISERMKRPFTILQSDFKSFGPRLLHTTILTVLEFLGVSSKWLGFFKTFLACPLALRSDAEGPLAASSQRTRGVPDSHQLSDMMSEGVLFCLDYAVNQQTRGANLYRIHDDLWVWGSVDVCLEAWNQILEFQEVMGIDLNYIKTGAVTVPTPSTLPIQSGRKFPLPSGSLRFGLLRLSAEQRQWVIDDGEVLGYILEDKKQLAGCQSILAWIQAWNSITRFLSSNFAQPAHCFGLDHVNMMLQAFRRIIDGIFSDNPEAKGNVVEYLRQRIKFEYNVDGIPDSFIYFPVELGCLEVHNPFVDLLLVRRNSLKYPSEKVKAAEEQEKLDYEADKKLFMEDRQRHNKSVKPFISYDDYIKNREETSRALLQAYQFLKTAPEQDDVPGSVKMKAALKELPAEGWGRDFGNDWTKLSPYWKWMTQQYGDGMMEKFGGLAVSDRKMLLVGLLKTLRSEKVRWLA